MYLNIEQPSSKIWWKNKKRLDDEFCRIIFHTEDVDALYYYLRNDEKVSNLGKFENKPADADWGERYFQMYDPDGNTIVFATPIT